MMDTFSSDIPAHKGWYGKIMRYVKYFFAPSQSEDNHVPYHPMVYTSPHILPAGEAIQQPPRLVVPVNIFRELVYYFRLVPKEFQVMGMVKRSDRNVFRLTELLVPPHTGGFARTDIDQSAFPRWLNSLLENGKDINDLRFQAHSHGTMDAYFSRQDIETIRDAYSNDWMISLVGNQKCFFVSRLDIFTPVPLSIALPLIVEYPECTISEEEAVAWKEKLMRAHEAREDYFDFRLVRNYRGETS